MRQGQCKSSWSPGGGGQGELKTPEVEIYKVNYNRGDQYR